ncbi:MAG: AAA family ATPase, partial [Lewinella sp.]|nr:AAA family ATPase [Lewinella sp.]
MIKHVNLYNWKSFSEANFYIDPLTVVIGTNASGKSNILDALDLVQKISLGNQITSAINGDSKSGGLRGGMEWIIKRGEDKCKIEIIIGDSQNESLEYQYSIEIGVIDDIRAE